MARNRSGGHCDAVDSNAYVVTVNIFLERVENWGKYGHKQAYCRGFRKWRF